MTSEEKDKLEKMYSYYGYNCFICGNRATQRAHIIGNTLLNRKLFGTNVIDSIVNWLPACSLECNKKIDVGKTNKAEKITIIINSALPEEEKRDRIEKIVREKRGKV